MQKLIPQNLTNKVMTSVLLKKCKIKVRKKMENSYSRKLILSKFSGYTLIAPLNAISNMYCKWHFDNNFISIF